MNETGVYLIRNTLTGKVYVGSAGISFRKRWHEHKSYLRKNKHCNRHLQSAWNRDGESAFEFLVLEEVVKEQCIAREQYWIDYYMAHDPRHGYNICPEAGSPAGRPCSEETRKKIGEANAVANRGKGHPQTPETKKKISEGHAGKTLAEEHKRRLTLRKMGRPWSLLRRMRCRKPN